MVRFRTRLTTLIGEISQKKWKNGKGSLKLKMDYVTISFSGRSGGRVGTSFGGKLPKGHGFESRPDFKYPRGETVNTTSLSLVSCRFDSCRDYNKK